MFIKSMNIRNPQRGKLQYAVLPKHFLITEHCESVYVYSTREIFPGKNVLQPSIHSTEQSLGNQPLKLILRNYLLGETILSFSLVS